MSAEQLYLALVHHPVVDKNGETIASAVTNLDLHDIARACRTYGAAGYYVVTPVEDQAVLVERILAHWTRGAGGRYNPKRRQALELIRLVPDLATAIDEITVTTGQRPNLVATTARETSGAIDWRTLRQMIDEGVPVLLILGTAWGLHQEIMDSADHVLKPLAGAGGYNHLSVRSAAAILLDRLMGIR